MNIVKPYLNRGGILPDRQNFEAFPNYFAEITWKIFLDSPDISGDAVLAEMLKRIADLGMQIGTEKTMRSMASFYIMVTRTHAGIEIMEASEKRSITATPLRTMFGRVFRTCSAFFAMATST